MKGFATGFVAKLKPNGSSLVYSTYLGGSGNINADTGTNIADSVESLSVDIGGNVYVYGITGSNDFPVTTGAFQTINKSFGVNNGPNQFVTKLNSAGTSLLYSTYLGSSLGTGGGVGRSMAVDPKGNAYVTGLTLGAGYLNGVFVPSDFPVTADAFQSKNNCPIGANAFLTELDPSGSSLVYSTYLGGSGRYVTVYPVGLPITVLVCGHAGSGLALDGAGGVYVVGSAGSPDFPTTTAALEINKTASSAAFVTKFSFGTSVSSSTITTLNADVNPQNVGNPVNFTALVKSSSGGTTPTGTMAFTVDGSPAATVALDSTGHATYSTSTLTPGSHTIGAVYSGDSTYSTSNGSFSETIIGTVTLSFSTSPTGFAYSVDGTSYTTAQSFTVAIGSQHTISANSPQTLSGALYIFSSWSDGGAQTHIITASANGTYTASFTPNSPTALFGNITSKSGTTDARIWDVQVTNGGPGVAVGAAISSVIVAQTGGAACSPAVTSLLPAVAGDLAAGATVTVPVTLDFTGCVALARFTVTVSLSANGGSNSASVVRLNQFR